MLYSAVYSPSSLSSVFRPYVFAVHSEQPDTFGHRLGPLSSEVSAKTSFITSVSRSCFWMILIPVCSWTTRWGRSITSSVSWWTVWSRWTCIAASTSSSWETTVRLPYTLQRFVFPLVRYGQKQTKKQTTWPPQRTQDVFAFSVKIVDDVEEVVRLVWRYKTRRQTFEASFNFPHSSFDFWYREECNWGVSDGWNKDKDWAQVSRGFSWL